MVRKNDDRIQKGIRSTQVGLLVNAVLVVVKVAAGVLGNSYALVADGVESSTDVFSSLIVWRGLKLSGRGADQSFHFGYGKAESLAAAAVSLMLMGAGLLIAVQAIREIVTPHHLPEPFTLVVLALVVLIKETLFRRVEAVAGVVGSRAVETDAWHHRADAITSAAAFVGISLALLGGPGWEPADDWAALLASGIIGYNGIRMFRPSMADLMDRAPDERLIAAITATATAVDGVAATEKIRARKAGLGYFVDLHVQAEPLMSLREAHSLGGHVRRRILAEVPEVIDVIIHMEPFETDRMPGEVSPGSS